MRTHTIMLLVAMMPLLALSQTEKLDKHAFSARVMAIDYGTPNDANLETTFGIEIAYRYLLNNHLGLAVPLKIGVADVQEDSQNRNVTSLDALLHYYPLGHHKKIAPYLLGGIGYVVENTEGGNAQMPIGAGLNIMMGTNSFLSLQAEYRLSTQDFRDNIQLGLGYLYQFGQIDSDGDGIADAVDECPDVVGTVAANGCPDADNDGIANKNDGCPTEAGTAEMNGCPDADNDGVKDMDDSCPELAGTPAMAGCPDSDGDGLHDGIDECPNEAGLEADKGCPIIATDSDGDGVIDEEDMCPDTAGLKTMNGCPDSDNDGVIDSEDRCPNKAGPYTGCPDTDGDGIIDADDRCPEEAGLTTNKGCPEIKENVREVLKLAAKAVQFETGSDQLKESSYVILDKIVSVMEQYPAYKLRIIGHTDNVGNAEHNKYLSEQRAYTCYEYLLNKGIKSNMISFTGYGEEDPITSNDTASGRLLNRRVEFDLIVE